MNDSELIKEFIQLINTDAQIQILVCKIEWNEGPHKPVSNWDTARTIAGKLSEAKIQEVIMEILEDRRYFRICLECSERNPVGWMNDDHICQGCAQANHGIVY